MIERQQAHLHRRLEAENVEKRILQQLIRRSRIPLGSPSRGLPADGFEAHSKAFVLPHRPNQSHANTALLA